MPALLYFVRAGNDVGTLMVVRGAGFLSVFTKPQQDALAMLSLKLHDLQITAAETLWGVWLLPLAVLVYRSPFLPRFLGIWLALGGFAYLAVSFVGVLWPQYQGKVFAIFPPATFAEIALMLWLVVKGSAAVEPWTPGPCREVGLWEVMNPRGWAPCTVPLLITSACLVPAVLGGLQQYMQGRISGDGSQWQQVVFQAAEWLFFGAVTPDWRSKLARGMIGVQHSNS